MPLVIISGWPCSGKTSFSLALKNYLEENCPSYKVCIMNDESLEISKQTAYTNSHEEKKARAAYISAIERSVSKDTVVIADNMNYIKGFRYQLYCIARAINTPHCAVHIQISAEDARKRNTETNAYPAQVFEELVDRYEVPNNMTKWDSPLFHSSPFAEVQPFEEICKAVCLEKARKPPTFATISRAANSNDLVSVLDRVTQDVCDKIVSQLKPFGPSTVILPDLDEPLYFSKPVSAGTLAGMRRQFIHMNRMHPLEPSKIPLLFANYIMSAI